MSLFIASAYAAPAASQQGQIPIWAMAGFFLIIFYFMIWRPQAKRNKEHRTLMESLGVGSEVIFAGGLMGRITKVDGDYATIEISPKVEVKIQKAAVISVLPSGTVSSL